MNARQPSPARLTLALPLLLTAAGSAAARQTAAAPTSEELWASEATHHALMRELELGVVRIPLEGDAYELLPPPNLETRDRVWDEGVLWQYEGQQRFDDTPRKRRPRWVYQDPETPLAPVPERILGTIAVDAYGRRWSARDVDMERLTERIAAYDDLVEATFGLEERLGDSEGPEEAELDPGGWVFFHPQTWYPTDCDGNGTQDISRYGSDDRSRSSYPMTDRQKKVLLISTPGGVSSGVMVDTRWMLTAAHAVTDDSGDPYNPITFNVFTLGNYQYGAAHLSANLLKIPSSYSGLGDVNSDYALVHLTSLPGTGWMAISTASNSAIESATNYNIGYPGYEPGCVLNNTAIPKVPGYDLAKFQHWSNGEVFSATANKIKTRLDTGAGHSGGPYYYYPSGCCGSHFVTGVHSGYFDPLIGSTYTGGPKGPAIRDWVIANT